jgi:hypothetical protein
VHKQTDGISRLLLVSGPAIKLDGVLWYSIHFDISLITQIKLVSSFFLKCTHKNSKTQKEKKNTHTQNIALNRADSLSSEMMEQKWKQWWCKEKITSILWNMWINKPRKSTKPVSSNVSFGTRFVCPYDMSL